VIARRWSGVVATPNRGEYVAYVEATGVSEYRRTPGCRFACILTRELDDARTEVVAFSLWETEGHIKAFAGEDIDEMVLYPEDQAYLLGTPELTHYDVPMFALPTPPEPS
jgi:hypothetical protein